MLAGNSLTDIFDFFRRKKPRTRQTKGGFSKRGISRSPERIATKIAGRKGAGFVKGIKKGTKNLVNKATGNVFARGGQRASTRIAAKVAGRKGATLAKGAGKTLGKIGGPIATVAMAAWDFADRKASGQSTLQAGAGTAAGVGGALAGAKGGAALGAAIGSIVPGVGTAIGGVLGGLIGAAGGAWASSKAADKLTGANKVSGFYRGGVIEKYEKGGVVRPRKGQPQESRPGKDVGGYYEIIKLFPDPERKGKSGQSESVSQSKNLWSHLNPLSWFGFGRRPEENDQGTPTNSEPNALKSLKDTSHTFKKIPFVGELMGLAVDIAMGQKPDKLVYDKIARSLVYLAQKLSTSKNIASITDIRSDVQKLESGGIASEINEQFLSLKFTEKSTQEIRDSISIAIEMGANDALTNIRREILDSDRKTFLAKKSQDSQSASDFGYEDPKDYRDQHTPPSPGGGSIPSSATGHNAKLLSFIAKGEGGYNSMNQGTRGGRIVGSTHNASTILGKNLTDMTIEEVMSNQSSGRLFAAGRYQIIPSTMKLAVQRANIPMSSKFDAQTQDKLGLALIYNGQRPTLSGYLQGKNNNLRGAMIDFAREWASVPHPDTGNSYYGSGNRSHHKVSEVREALTSARRGVKSESSSESQQPRPSSSPNYPSSRGTPQKSFPTGYAPSTPGKFNTIEYITGERGHPNFELAGHGLPSNYHDHIAFKSIADKETAKRSLISSGIRIGSEYRPGDRGYHGVNLAIDIPGYQWGGSGAIGEREFKGSRKVRQVLGLDSFGGSDVRRRGIETRFHGGIVNKDSLVKIHAGEFVVDKDSVDLFGVDFFESVNKVENLVSLKKIAPTLFQRIDNVIKGSFNVVPELKEIYTQSDINESSRKTTKNLEDFIQKSEGKTEQFSMSEDDSDDSTNIQVIPGNHPHTGSGFMIKGVIDGNSRPLILSKGAIKAFGKMMQDSNGEVKGTDVASGKRSESHNRRVGGVPNSNHLGGNALDIHGPSQAWMRRNGRKYGWIINDYPGSHGGHFDYKGQDKDNVGDTLSTSPSTYSDIKDGGSSGGGGGGGGGGGRSGSGSPYAGRDEMLQQNIRRRGPIEIQAEPTESLIPGSNNGANINVSLTQNQKEALRILGKYESAGAGAYNAVNQIGIAGGRGVLGYSGDFSKMQQHGGKKLTDMTIGEILDLQANKRGMSNDEWIRQGRLHAVGRYQFVGNTLPGLVANSKIPRDAKFTEEVQDLLALQLMKERGIQPWIGPSDKATVAERAIIEEARKDPITASVKPISDLNDVELDDVEKDQQIAGSTKDNKYGRLGIPNTDGQDTGADIELFGRRGEIGKTFSDNSKDGPYGNRGVEISFPYELIYYEKIPGGRNAGRKSVDVSGSTSRDYKAVTGSTGFGHVGSYFYKDPKTGKMFEIMMGHGNKPFKKFKDGEKIAAGTVVGWQGASGSSDSMQGGVYDHVTFHVNAVDGGDPNPIFNQFTDSLLSGEGAKLTEKIREENRAKKSEELLAKNPKELAKNLDDKVKNDLAKKDIIIKNGKFYKKGGGIFGMDKELEVNKDKNAWIYKLVTNTRLLPNQSQSDIKKDDEAGESGSVEIASKENNALIKTKNLSLAKKSQRKNDTSSSNSAKKPSLVSSTKNLLSSTKKTINNFSNKIINAVSGEKSSEISTKKRSRSRSKSKSDVKKAQLGGIIGKDRSINKFAGYENPSNQSTIIVYQEKITYINRSKSSKSSKSITIGGNASGIDNTYHLRRN
jgi:muramidase (phage lysozyme)